MKKIQEFRRFLKLRPEEIYTIYKGADGDEVMKTSNYQSWDMERQWPMVREIALNFNSHFRVISEHMGIYEVSHNDMIYIVYLKSSVTENQKMKNSGMIEK